MVIENSPPQKAMNDSFFYLFIFYNMYNMLLMILFWVVLKPISKLDEFILVE